MNFLNRLKMLFLMEVIINKKIKLIKDKILLRAIRI